MVREGHLPRNGDRKIHRGLWLASLKTAITYATDFKACNSQVKLASFSEAVKLVVTSDKRHFT